MKIYIAGKITGDCEYREKFERAAELLRREGHVVLNPAVLPAGLSDADYMRICIAMIDVADRVALLPGWRESHGAQLERKYCAYIGKELVEL